MTGVTGGIVVIGVGNPYRRDDGAGAAVVDALRRRGVPADLTTSLGETTELIEMWDGADLVVLVDAVVTRPPGPGRIHRLTVDRPLAGDSGGSTHGLGLGEAIDLARVLGRLPRRLVLYAIGAGDVGHGVALTPAVRAAADRVAAEIAEQVAAHLASRTGTIPAG